ncbi:MAG: UvrD-helicase domain-containing protein [Gorillibacterium sp.]|nr:UvrD-helicase domain-containing protein [Gorillibacterium sp.]
MISTTGAPKPEGSTWTDEQWQAVIGSGENILIAAAAGSGKTAVLVERIIRRVTDEEQPLDVDRLLVATFTNAAAAEMRERIRRALENELEKRPDSRHLRAQLALLPRSSITTVHSFCLEVIRRHYRDINLDPGFRIANQTEAELIKLEIMEQLVDDYYASAEEGDGFWLLVDGYGGQRGDEELFRLVLSLYEFSRSHPSPEAWLHAMAAHFEAAAEPDGLEFWFSSLKADVRLELDGVIGLLQEAMRTARLPAGPAPYIESLAEEISRIEALRYICSGDWEELFALFQETVFDRLKPCRGDQYDKDLQKRAQELRDTAKKKLAKLRTELFERDSAAYAEELRKSTPAIKVLVQLVLTFAEQFGLAKREKGLVDFSDLEHYALQILCIEMDEQGVHQPSLAAMEYREHYEEVLLDEYQDTNRVQEAIVGLIARTGKGNRFMVGDVKQSIYRFRLAEPGLFLSKYKAYRQDDSTPCREEQLLEQPVHRYTGVGPAEGRRIDLARNFRSRRQVVDGVNYLFRQIMEESVGEIHYDRSAELVCGAIYPELDEDHRVELAIIDKSIDDSQTDEDGLLGSEDPDYISQGAAREEDSIEADGDEKEAETGMLDDRQEAETARLEARFIADRIHKLMGDASTHAFSVTGKGGVPVRPLAYRDIVILLRATQSWSPVFMEEMKKQGIPVYAELNTGYFAAIEVEVVLSLLKVIDNPYQDIPLAGVLRSPIVGLTAEELAQVRVTLKAGAFYDAILTYMRRDQQVYSPTAHEPFLGLMGADSERVRPNIARDEIVLDETAAALDITPEELNGGKDIAFHNRLTEKLRHFLAQLGKWREEARKETVADLIRLIYRDTLYYDFVGGLTGGMQRQANLRALHDRARQYEATSFRGVFRFLRFIARMRETGGDLGTAKALGEQENVVRVMTIHKSKGLEFPVVFVAGLSKLFNRQDLYGSFLIHKDLGFGPKYIDTQLRLAYPSLPSLAIRRRLKLELLAEEMRVLYVALTRAREKLILVGTVKDAAKQATNWERAAVSATTTLPDYELAGAACYLDWIGPALYRHPDAEVLRQAAGKGKTGEVLGDSSSAKEAYDASRWSISIHPAGAFTADPAMLSEHSAPDAARLEALKELRPITLTSSFKDAVERKLSWSYPYPQAPNIITKTTVSEIKRLSERNGYNPAFGDELTEEAPRVIPGTTEATRMTFRRPRFIETRQINASERGTVYHAVLQRLELNPGLTEQTVVDTIEEMVSQRILLPEQAAAVKAAQIYAFFETDLGSRLLFADRKLREVPFSYKLAAKEIYQELKGSEGDESVLVQGIVDCLFEDAEGLVLLDYKTDNLQGTSAVLRAARYQTQLDLYVRAVRDIWKRSPAGVYLYFFESGEIVEMSADGYR